MTGESQAHKSPSDLPRQLSQNLVRHRSHRPANLFLDFPPYRRISCISEKLLTSPGKPNSPPKLSFSVRYLMVSIRDQPGLHQQLQVVRDHEDVVLLETTVIERTRGAGFLSLQSQQNLANQIHISFHDTRTIATAFLSGRVTVTA